MNRILIAGVGNIFLGDDGFGVEVARRLAGDTWPPDVTVADFGIRGIHLAYQIIGGYDAVIIVDAVSRGAATGTVFVIEPDLEAAASDSVSDSHNMVLDNVFAMVRTLGEEVPPRILIVGCELADLSEKIGLSECANNAVPDAIRAVREIIDGLMTVFRVPSTDETGTIEEA
jgi:hydrogenase maturation protease